MIPNKFPYTNFHGLNLDWVIKKVKELNTAVTGKEDKSNKVTAINSTVTNVQYPSAKAVYDYHDASKQNKLTAGENITINNDVISSTGGTSAVWGNITGSITNQSDLITKFNSKQDDIGGYEDAGVTYIAGTSDNIQVGGENKSNIFIYNDEDNGPITITSSDSYITVDGIENRITIHSNDDSTIFDGGNGIDLDGGHINNVANPYSAQDAATKYYVDNHHDSTKQALLTTAQLNAVNSGITSTKVTTYDGYAATKQNTLTAGENITIVNDVISASGGGGTSAVWGNITGTLSNQGDLNTALNAREEKSYKTDTVAPISETSSTYYPSCKAVAKMIYTGGATYNITNLENDTINMTADDLTIDCTNTISLIGESIQANGSEILSNDYIDTTITSSATNTHVPSSLAVYSIVGNIEALLQALR